jgi:iron complex outermembrane receptor protein
VFANYTNHVMDNFTLRQPPIVGNAPMRMASNVDQLTVGARFAVSVSPLPMWTMTNGIDMQSQRHRLREKVPGVPVDDFAQRPWRQDARSGRVGLFSESTWDTSAQTRVVAGARVDRAHAEDFRAQGPGAVSASAPRRTRRHAWLPSGFLRYEYDLSPASTWYVGIGHAQRFPDYWDLFAAGLGPQGQANAFSGVRPERTTQVDVGIRYQNAGRQAWVNGYIGRVSDFILFDYGVPNAGSVTTRARNVQARIWGGETGVRWPLTRHVHTEAALAYAWGSNTQDARALPQIPPLELRLGLGYQQGPVSAGVQWRLVARQTRLALAQGNVAGQDLGPSAGFGVVTAHARYAVTKRVGVSVGVDNLFNRRYAEHLNKAGSAGFGYGAATPFKDPGRAAWAKVTIDL